MKRKPSANQQESSSRRDPLPDSTRHPSRFDHSTVRPFDKLKALSQVEGRAHRPEQSRGTGSRPRAESRGKLSVQSTVEGPVTHHHPALIRINKFFTEHGVCSRRDADRLVQSGAITINGRVAKLGDRVGPEDVITRGGQVIPWGKAPVYIKYHKPVGVTTTSESHVERNIIREIGHPERIFPIGRLDKDSSGLILLTNDGDIVNEVLRTEFGHEREYIVVVDRPFDQSFLDQMSHGVAILGRKTKPCRTARLGLNRFRIVLTEGRNRQIRRMCHALGHRVTSLHRTRIMHITVKGLGVGAWKELTTHEREQLLETLARYRT